MLPILTFDLPSSPDWLYEVKYDGFRAILDWNLNEITLTSRNGKPLFRQFPEIKDFLVKRQDQFKPFLPLQLDGELVVLENPFKANFSSIQVRGRLKSEKKIMEQAKMIPCHFMAFDILQLEGASHHSIPFKKRKKILAELFRKIGFHLEAIPDRNQLVQFVKTWNQYHELWENVVLYDGEGIVIKHKNSLWDEGKRSTQWLKYKNWKFVTCFVTALEKTNGYIYIGVYKDKDIQVIGQVLFGFKPEEKQSLYQIIKQNKLKEDKQFIYVEPAICLEVKYLEVYESQLREPHFDRFRFDIKPADCKYDQFIHQRKNLPKELEITHPYKPLWDRFQIQKADYIHYLREVSPFILPFLQNRNLTVIRYPHGMMGEAFFQKNCPEYAPNFVKTHEEDGIHYIVCQDLKTLMWLGNQLAIEFHIPFNMIESKGPSEIVFDLDPPSKDAFHLAIQAAILIKEVCDQLQLISFIKTSGNKGLQIYLPLPENVFTFDDTRLFTTFIAEYLVSRNPDSFTIERMKKNRRNRLYIDYVQHGEGKTIVAPYSMRGNEHAGVATPLYWEEVNENLTVELFNMENALKRLKKQFDPFKDFFQAKSVQPFAPVLEILKQKKG